VSDEPRGARQHSGASKELDGHIRNTLEEGLLVDDGIAVSREQRLDDRAERGGLRAELCVWRERERERENRTV